MSLINAKRLYFAYITFYVIVVLILYPFYSSFEFVFDPAAAAKAAFTALSVSFGFVYLVEKYLWTWKSVRFALGIRVPCVHGRWTGFLLSSFSKHKRKHDIVIEFHQTLHHLSVWYYDENAVTRSRLAGFFQNDPEGGPATILCVYHNHPINTSIRKLQTHSGTMELYVDPAARKIKGIYYNNPHQRATYGNMELAFVGKKLFGAFEERGK